MSEPTIRADVQPGAVADQQKHLCTEHLMTNLKGRTVSSGLISVTSQGYQFILNMVSISILARMLTPGDFGLVAMVTTVMGFLQVLKDAGLSSATVQKEGLTHAQVSNLFWVNIVLSGSVTLLIACAAPLIAMFYHESKLVPITLVLATTFLFAGSSAQHLALLNRRMQFKHIAAIQMSSMTFGVLVGIVMARFHCGYWSLVGLNLGTPIATCVMTWMLSPWRPQFFARGSETRPLLGFGASLAVSGFLHTVSRGTDGLLVGRFFGADATGFYSRGTTLLLRPLDQIMASLNTVFVPALSRLQTQPERYRVAYLKVFEAVAIAGFPCAAMFLALARPLTLLLLGPQWEKAADIFASFTLVALFYPLNNVASWLFVTQGRGRDSVAAFCMSATIAVLSFTAGLPYGPNGIARSYSIACLVLLLPIRFYITGRRGPVRTRDLWAGFLRFLPLWVWVWGVTYLVRLSMPHATCFVQVLVCAPIGLAAAAAFLGLIPYYRRRTVALVDALKEFKQLRKGK